MRKYQIPGAAFVLVQGNKIIFSRGYGWANITRRIPVDPYHTVFRVASVTKLFTTVAVMQLAEEGKLHLHVDVNHYLKRFHLKEKYPQPVTLAALLTHTAGLEDLSIGVAARQPDLIEPLGFYLAHHMPAQIRPPGQIISYSNHGLALAGYIVQTVSGQLYEKYVQENILKPLAMTHSGFIPSARLQREFATGYSRWRGLHPVPLDYFNIQPASGLCATPVDIAHFMIAMMNGGRYGRARLLTPSSVARMERQHFTEDPRLSGRAYGFYEKHIDGLRVIGHGGDVRGFGSLLALVPEKRLGFFITENVDEPRFDAAIERRFFQRYFPASSPKVEPVLNLPSDAARVAGSYRLNPYSATTFAKLFTLYWQYRVTANRDGSIELHYPHHYHPPSRWVEVQPLFYICPTTGNKAVFGTDSSGHITEMFTDEEAYDRLPRYATARFQVRLVKTLLLIFFSALLVWPAEAIAHWINRRRHARRREASGSESPHGAVPTLARVIAWVASASVIFFVVAFLAVIHRLDLWHFAYGIPKQVGRLLVIPPLTVILVMAMIFFAIRAWAGRWWSVFDRLHYSVVALAGILWVWFVLYWRLLWR